MYANLASPSVYPDFQAICLGSTPVDEMKDIADSFRGLLDPAKDEEEGAPSAPYVYQPTAHQYEKEQ